LKYFIVFLFLFFSSASNSFAAPFDQFLMPGKLIDGHKKYEKQCEKCHESFDKQAQDKLCLACHKKVNRDVEKKIGFHGKSKQVKANICKFCHTDHVGRGANVVGLDVHTFDHRQTDFKLKGMHKKVTCISCHPSKENQEKKKYREAKHACVDCHDKVDVHQNRLGKKCHNCHSEKRWNKTKFDHDKTDYKLTGKHKKVSCGDCHPNQIFKDTPKQCISCHKLQDVHRSEFGTKCHKCHKTSKWKSVKFDHDKTKFKLRNRHAKISCNACHKTNNYKKKLKRKCYTCHLADDKHSGSYGKKCKACHVDTKWTKITFNHDKDTKFKLKGDHKKALCNACHPGILYEDKVKKSCKSCHKADDVHNGKQEQDCQYCHQQNDWRKKLFFDHDLTNFPLIGLHGVTACENCHMTPEYKMERHDCFSCHKTDDVHKKKLTSDCLLCHNPNDWGIWAFDHDKQSDYKLDGAHKEIHCEGCHQEPVKDRKKIVLSDKCHSCHQYDDVHSGQFGKYCDRCHSTESFKKSDLMN